MAITPGWAIARSWTPGPASVSAAASALVAVEAANSTLLRDRQASSFIGRPTRALIGILAAGSVRAPLPAVGARERERRRPRSAAALVSVLTTAARLPLLAESPGPAVVGVAAVDGASDGVRFDHLAHRANSAGGRVKICLFQVHPVDISEQLLDRVHDPRFRGSLGQDKRLDHVGLERPGRTWVQERCPVARWQIVPRRGRIAMHGWHDERSGLDGFGGPVGSCYCACVALVSTSRDRSLVHGCPQQ